MRSLILLSIALPLVAADIAAIGPRDPVPDPPAPQALLSIRRVYVDKLGGGETSGQIRDLLITALQNSKLFVITENPDRADAILRGSAEDLVFTEKYSSGEGLSARTGADRTTSSSARTSRLGRFTGLTLSENESTHIEERKHEAMATVRLVNKDGDVVWSTTEESTGAKFRGASADVADKVAKRLALDVDRARKAQPLR